MRLGVCDQVAERFALELHEVGLIDQRAGIHIATADDFGDQCGDMLVEFADEAAVAHIDQRAANRRNAAAACDRERLGQRRAPARCRHRLGFVDRDEQQLVLVRDDDVAVQQIAELARFDRAGSDLGHRRSGEAFGEEGQQVLAGAGCRIFSGTARDVGETPRTRHQAHAHFDQADVAFHVCHAACGIHRQLAATAQRHAVDGSDHWHLRIAHAQHHVLQFLLDAFDRIGTADHEGGHGGFQIGADAERRVAGPDHHRGEVALGHVDRFHQAFHHLGADGVHLVLDAGDEHLAVQRPGAQRLAFGNRGACGAPVGQVVFAEQFLGEDLALIHRQFAAGNEFLLRCAPRALCGVHAAGLSNRAFEDPFRQRCLGQRLACVDVFLDHLRDFEPTGFLPQLERALLHAEAPAHGLIDVACGVGDVDQMNGGVLETVAQNRPEELAFRTFCTTQQFQALARRLSEHAAVDIVGLLASRHVVFAVELKLQNVAADLLEETGLGLLTEVAQVQQLLQHGRRAVVAVERIGFEAQVVLQRLDHVSHRVETHHVRRTERAARCTAQLLAGEVVDHVVGQTEILGLLHRRQHAGDADAVGDEVGRIVRAHHALAERRRHEGLELVEHFGIGRRRVDQLHQLHVARWVEEVNAAEARLDRIGQSFGQLGDRQTRGVRCDQRGLRNERRDLVIQIELPIHALGNRLDDQIAALQELHVLFVVGGLNQVGVFGHTNRRRLELLQIGNRLFCNAALRTFLGGQVKQNDRHLHVDEVGGNLRAHHACAEHGDFLHLESGHVVCSLGSSWQAHACQFASVQFTRCQVWVRQKGPK